MDTKLQITSQFKKNLVVKHLNREKTKVFIYHDHKDIDDVWDSALGREEIIEPDSLEERIEQKIAFMSKMKEYDKFDLIELVQSGVEWPVDLHYVERVPVDGSHIPVMTKQFLGAGIIKPSDW